MRQILTIVLIVWVSPGVLFADELASPPCPMQPMAWTIDLHGSGFSWLPGGDFSGTCGDVPSEGWSRIRSGAGDLSVHIEGPEGSGRFWRVIVGIPQKQQSKPGRGVCIWASTVGWRTLQHYSHGALPWLADVDNDGSLELILWDSFPLHDDASMAEYALVAWVYRQASKDSLVVDLKLSRDFAISLAKEYRSPLKDGSAYLCELRAQAAEALEKLADEQCSLTHGVGR